MTPRERVLAAIRHEEPDKVPIDLGGTGVTGIQAICYNKLKAHLIEHGAKPIVYLWKEHGFIETGGVLKGDEFHGLPILGVHRLPGHEPPDGSHPFPHMGMVAPCPYKIQDLP